MFNIANCAVALKFVLNFIVGRDTFDEIMVFLRFGLKPLWKKIELEIVRESYGIFYLIIFFSIKNKYVYLNRWTITCLNPEINMFEVLITNLIGKLDPLVRNTHDSFGVNGSSFGIFNSG